MIAIVSPTGWRVAVTAAIPVLERSGVRGSIRIFSARNPSSRRRSARSARSAGARSMPDDA